jgi:hypothetical protein
LPPFFAHSKGRQPFAVVAEARHTCVPIHIYLGKNPQRDIVHRSAVQNTVEIIPEVANVFFFLFGMLPADATHAYPCRRGGKFPLMVFCWQMAVGIAPNTCHANASRENVSGSRIEIEAVATTPPYPSDERQRQDDPPSTIHATTHPPATPDIPNNIFLGHAGR